LGKDGVGGVGVDGPLELYIVNEVDIGLLLARKKGFVIDFYHMPHTCTSPSTSSMGFANEATYQTKVITTIS
jgi:hypothetical protein